MPLVIILDKNSLHCWFLPHEKLIAPTCSLFRQSRSQIYYIISLVASYLFNSRFWTCFRTLLCSKYVVKLFKFTKFETSTPATKKNTLKQYSEIFEWLKHHFSVTPIDRYSLKQRYVQNSCWLWFYFGEICGITWIILLYWILYCNFWCRGTRNLNKCKDFPILSKLNCSCRIPMEVRLI